MIEFTPFKAGHLRFLKPQPAQRSEHTAILQSGEAAALEGPMSLSGWADSRCVGAAGLIHVRPHRAVAWMILSADASEYMLPIVKKIRRVARAVPYKRIELTVADGFSEGERFARLLGAVCETPEPMRYFGANERHERMYALIKGSK